MGGVWVRTRRTFIVANMESAISTMLEGTLEWASERE